MGTSKKGDPLEVLNESIPWSMFRRVLKKIERKSNAGRKPYDPVLMFKILVLQSLYNLSDEQAEYQIRDSGVFFCLSGNLRSGIPRHQDEPVTCTPHKFPHVPVVAK